MPLAPGSAKKSVLMLSVLIDMSSSGMDSSGIEAWSSLRPPTKELTMLLARSKGEGRPGADSVKASAVACRLTDICTT